MSGFVSQIDKYLCAFVCHCHSVVEISGIRPIVWHKDFVLFMDYALWFGWCVCVMDRLGNIWIGKVMHNQRDQQAFRFEHRLFDERLLFMAFAGEKSISILLSSVTKRLRKESGFMWKHELAWRHLAPWRKSYQSFQSASAQTTISVLAHQQIASIIFEILDWSLNTGGHIANPITNTWIVSFDFINSRAE